MSSHNYEEYYLRVQSEINRPCYLAVSFDKLHCKKNICQDEKSGLKWSTFNFNVWVICFREVINLSKEDCTQNTQFSNEQKQTIQITEQKNSLLNWTSFFEWHLWFFNRTDFGVGDYVKLLPRWCRLVQIKTLTSLVPRWASFNFASF